MVDGKDDVIKRRQKASRISAQRIVAELNTIFFTTGYIARCVSLRIRGMYVSRAVTLLVLSCDDVINKILKLDIM